MGKANLHPNPLSGYSEDYPDDANAVEDRRWIDAVEAAGTGLIRALAVYGFPASDAASTAPMSIEARNLHNAARRFIIAFNSTGSAADEPAVTNGQ